MIYAGFSTSWWLLTLALAFYSPPEIDVSEVPDCYELEEVKAPWQPFNESFDCWWESNFRQNGSPGMAVAILKEG